MKIGDMFHFEVTGKYYFFYNKKLKSLEKARNTIDILIDYHKRKETEKRSEKL